MREFFIGSEDAASLIHRAPRGVRFCFSSSSNQQTSSQPVSSTSGATSPAINGTGNAVTTGAPAVNANSSNVNTGTSVNVASGGSITTSDPAVIEDALDQLSTVYSDALSGANAQAQQVVSTVGNLTNAESSLANSVLSQDQATAANTASGGQTNTNQTVLYVVIAALGAVALLAFFGRKKS